MHDFQEQYYINSGSFRWCVCRYFITMYNKTIGPLQLAIHVVQNRHAGEQKLHWEKTNKRRT